MYYSEIWIERTDDTIDKIFLQCESVKVIYESTRSILREEVGNHFHPTWTAGAEIRKGNELLLSMYETAMDPMTYTREAIF